MLDMQTQQQAFVQKLHIDLLRLGSESLHAINGHRKIFDEALSLALRDFEQIEGLKEQIRRTEEQLALTNTGLDPYRRRLMSQEVDEFRGLLATKEAEVARLQHA